MQNIPFQSQKPIQIYYKDLKLKKHYIPDLLVFEQIVVELKAVSKLLPEHEAQIMNYMRIAKKPVGYLINLAPIESVEWKRFIL